APNKHNSKGNYHDDCYSNNWRACTTTRRCQPLVNKAIASHREEDARTCISRTKRTGKGTNRCANVNQRCHDNTNIAQTKIPKWRSRCSKFLNSSSICAKANGLCIGNNDIKDASANNGSEDSKGNIAARIARLLTKRCGTLKAREREEAEDGSQTNVTERLIAWYEWLSGQASASPSPAQNNNS